MYRDRSCRYRRIPLMWNIFDLLFRVFSLLLVHQKPNNATIPKRQFVSSGGTDDFFKLVVRESVFVDKSLLIEEYLRYDGEALLISRPSKWGKTVNLDMIKCFLEIEVNGDGQPLPEEQKINRLLFAGGSVETRLKTVKELKPLKIAGRPDMMALQGTHPVIFISFKDVLAENYRGFEKRMRMKMGNLFLRYKYVKSLLTDEEEKTMFAACKSSSADVERLELCIPFLSELLHKFFQQRKVHILIDEYDAPLHYLLIKLLRTKKFEEALKSEEFDRTITLIRKILGNAFKGNAYMEKGLISGVFPLSSTELQTGLNNLRQYTLLEKRFAEYYGFSRTEVDQLLTGYSMRDKEDRMRDWYDGYNVAGLALYNPYAVTECLKELGEYDMYWENSGSIDLAHHLMSCEETREKIQYLAAGEAITAKVETDKNVYHQLRKGNIFPFLLYAGYVTPLRTGSNQSDGDQPGNSDDWQRRIQLRLHVPNKEIADAMKNRISDWRDSKFPWLKLEDTEQTLLTTLMADKWPEFEKWFRYNLVRMRYISFSVQFYANTLYLLMTELDRYFEVHPPRDSDESYSNVLLIARRNTKYRNAVLFKVNTSVNNVMLNCTAAQCLKEIDQGKYEKILRGRSDYSHIETLTKIGVAFYHKDVQFKRDRVNLTR